MIKENITAYINSYAHEGEIIIPSLVLTSTKQDETVNLSYTPNFQLRLEDSYGYINVSDTTYVTFAVESYNYTAYAKALVRDGSYVTLQYANGLSKSAQPAPEPPEPEPTVTYITFDAGTFSYASTMEGNSDNNPYTISDFVCENELSSFSNDFISIYNDASVVDSLGNDVTAYATISSNEFTRIDSEGTDYAYAWAWQYDFDNTENNTPVTAYITASYTVGGQTFTATNEYVCLATYQAPEPEPEPDPLDSMLTISGPLTPEVSGNYTDIAYTAESNDVYLRSAGLEYDSSNDNYYIPSNTQHAELCFDAPSTHRFETITFVNLDATYKAVVMQIGTIGNGVITEDGDGNTVWTRNVDYDPTIDSTLPMDFTQMIQQVGATMTCDEIHITMAPYVAPEPEPEEEPEEEPIE